MEQLHKTLSHIMECMDRYVVGHDDIKEAILLGLVGQRIYLKHNVPANNWSNAA